ncbi:hypothetical protein LCGC14_1480460 [marine sediment metagenome]|uniref:Recombination endonuclease VII n=1 Tax=marine sediment metagenome TaxID=412755 RepID=A0A0F9LQ76_9ZZZZ
MKKKCTQCKKKKDLSEFYKKQHAKDGLTYWCKSCHNSWNREHYHKPEIKRKISKKQKEYFRNVKLKQRYGITIKDWDRMFVEQEGCCAMCGKHQSKLDISLCVDHNHKTGKVRGLLCQQCNAKLAIVEDKQFCAIAQRYLDNGGIIK